MFAYQRFTAVLLLIYDSLFLSGVHYCLSVFCFFASWQCICSHDTVCDGVFSKYTNNCARTPSPFTGSSPQWRFSVPEDKGNIDRRHFGDTDDIRNNNNNNYNTTAALKSIPQNQFHNCFERWTRRWHQCIASQGSILKGPQWYSAMRYVALLPRWVRELYCQNTCIIIFSKGLDLFITFSSQEYSYLVSSYRHDIWTPGNIDME
jgi:hypothetical protein